MAYIASGYYYQKNNINELFGNTYTYDGYSYTGMKNDFCNDNLYSPFNSRYYNSPAGYFFKGTNVCDSKVCDNPQRRCTGITQYVNV